MTPNPRPIDQAESVLAQTERTRVVRTLATDGQAVVRKRGIGPDASRRVLAAGQKLAPR